jgi:hypothetical protein
MLAMTRLTSQILLGLHLATGGILEAMTSDYDPWDTVQDVGNVAEAFTDALTFGSASRLNDALGAGQYVNRCGIGHKLGTAAGIVTTIALGGAMGAEAAEANAGEQGFEFSHWIPDRMGGPRILENGNWISIAEHAVNDPFRYRFMPAAWKALNPMNPAWLQQLNRIPFLLRGAAAGGAIGGAGAMTGRSCGCH